MGHGPVAAASRAAVHPGSPRCHTCWCRSRTTPCLAAAWCTSRGHMRMTRASTSSWSTAGGCCRVPANQPARQRWLERLAGLAAGRRPDVTHASRRPPPRGLALERSSGLRMACGKACGARGAFTLPLFALIGPWILSGASALLAAGVLPAGAASWCMRSGGGRTQKRRCEWRAVSRSRPAQLVLVPAAVHQASRLSFVLEALRRISVPAPQAAGPLLCCLWTVLDMLCAQLEAGPLLGDAPDSCMQKHLSLCPASPRPRPGGQLHAQCAAHSGAVPLPPHPAPRHQAGWGPLPPLTLGRPIGVAGACRPPGV